MTIPHNLTREEATTRIKDLINKLQAQYGNQVKNLEESWTGTTGNFSFKIMGLQVSGRLDVEDSTVTMQGDLPFAATPFKGQIENTIRQQMESLLQ
jgi:hypothetical protein